MLRVNFLLIIFTLTIVVLLSGCSSGPKSGNNSSVITTAPPRVPTGTISTGKTVAAASVPVSPSGGTISVTEAGTPITGLELKVPASSYTDKREFKISYAPVEKHSFGDSFNPITPIITVENGGGYSGEIMKLKIPVKVPSGQFAMGFIYDEKTKTLTGLNTIAQDATSITLGTRHFCSLLVSMIDEKLLKKDIDTGFRPGIDDWQFVNNGSYVAAGGHCAGQSVTALWYYATQPDGQGYTLNGRYDNNGNQPSTPKLDEDDNLAYRFASTVHNDINWTSFENKFWDSLAGADDEVTWKLFAYSMQMSGQPQEVGIYSRAGGGHDMICYRVKDKTLYISDPNYPGNEDRRIEFADGKFKPYNSGANKREIEAGHGKNYETIEFCSKTTTVPWETVAARWTEFKAGTIGKGVFPDYKIVWLDDKGVKNELKNGLAAPTKQLAISIDAGFTGAKAVVYRDAVKLSPNAGGKYELKPGNNLLGVLVTGTNEAYVDFKYFNVIYSGLSIDPPSLDAEINKEYTFTARMENPPANTKFTWSIDDVVSASASPNTLKTTFKSDGTHIITVKSLDSSGKEIGQAKSIVTIKSASGFKLEDLQKMSHLGGTMEATVNLLDWQASGQAQMKSMIGYNFPLWRELPKQPNLKLTWNGTTFKGNSVDPADPKSTHEVSGTVSADGQTLLTLSYKGLWKAPTNSAGYSEYLVQTVTLRNVPLSKIPNPAGIGFFGAGGSWAGEATFQDTWYLKDKKYMEKSLVSIEKLNGLRFTFSP